MPNLEPGLKPTRLSHPDVTPAVWGVLETPPTPGSHPGVILLHGSSGWHPEYAQIAKTLAYSGFVALAVDYFVEIDTGTSPDDAPRNKGHWQAIVRNAVTFLQASPLVSGRPVGLVGYSLGAFLAVSVASSIPAVAAVVDFFGGGDKSAESLEQEVRNFPPLLILHGDADSSVPIEFGYRLQEAVLAHAGEVEMHIYPGAGHGFNAPWSPAYSEPEALDSTRRTIEFLKRRLGD